MRCIREVVESPTSMCVSLLHEQATSAGRENNRMNARRLLYVQKPALDPIHYIIQALLCSQGSCTGWDLRQG